MKKLLIIILILLSLIISIDSVFSATYYVKNGGNDGLDGLSDGNAWATIGKVNTVNFANTDIVQLKRGSTFTDATLTLDSTSVGRTGITIQDYNTGNKPRIDGNSVRPILINHALINLTLKNIDISGSDTSGNRCHINNVNGIVIDGIDYNGHTGSSSYVRSSAMNVSYVDGDIEIKNCTIQNVMKDTFANTLSAWGSNDACGFIMYYAGDENVKSSGMVSIHDNVIHDIYSDCLQLAGLNTTTNVYDNELYNFGENAVDMKHSKYIDFYQNTVSHNDYGVKEDWYGPAAICAGSSVHWATFKASDNIVRENYIHTSKYTAIVLPGIDAIIKNNYIKNCMMGVRISLTGAKIHNNVFELTTGKPTLEPYASRWAGTMLSGIRVDQGAKTSGLIYNNTFYITSSDHLYGIGYHPDTDVSGIEIKNNIIYMTRNSSSVYPLYVQDVSGDYPTVSYNNFYGVHLNRVYWKGTVYDATEQAAWRSAGHTGSLFIDPLLNAAGDKPTPYFELQPTSPDIDTGIYVGFSYEGTAPDMGAYEYSIVLPAVTTQAVADITTTTATGHGTITNTSGENATKRGICWNITGNPTVANDKSEELGSFGIGAFSRSMTNLTPGQHYYVKAYAYNTAGYGYGNQVEFNAQSAEDTISQAGWSLHYVDSEEVTEESGNATNSFDGNATTRWHTEWGGAPDPPCPHEIQINLGASYDIDGFRYLPRQDGSENGRIAQYEFYTSTDGTNWGSTVAADTFVNDMLEKEVNFSSVTGNYIRLKALSEVNSGNWTSAAEINVLGVPAGSGSNNPSRIYGINLQGCGIN